MKKWQIIVLIILGSIFGVYHILSFTGVFAVYKNATPSNEPNIKEGEFIITTNLLYAKPGDFVSYKFEHPDSLNTHYRVHRLVALENDILEIKDGILFINGKDFDKNYSLAHKYKISIEELKKFDLDQNEIEDYYFWLKSEDTITMFVNDEVAENHNLKDRIVTKIRSETDELIKAAYNEDWNKDNFGPIKIPLGKVFVMGDNRDASEDSRYIGPVDKSALKGVLIK